MAAAEVEVIACNLAPYLPGIIGGIGVFLGLLTPYIGSRIKHGKVPKDG